MRINGKEYRIPELGFEQMCQLEDIGISIFDIQQPKKKLMSILRAFAGVAMGVDAPEASRLIEQHLLGGGSMDGWVEEILKAVETSDFFQAMMKKEQKKALKSSTKEIEQPNE